MSNCHPLEVLGRGSGTRHPVGENLNYSFIEASGSQHAMIYA